MKLETGIPIPPSDYGGRWKTIIREMEVGQSFVVKNHNERQAVLRAGREIAIRLTSRKLEDKTLRIWRTA